MELQEHLRGAECSPKIQELGVTLLFIGTMDIQSSTEAESWSQIQHCMQELSSTLRPSSSIWQLLWKPGSCPILQDSDDPDEVYISYIPSCLAEECCAGMLCQNAEDFFGISLLTLSVFMGVTAPEFMLQHKNPEDASTCKLLDLMGQEKHLKLMQIHATISNSETNAKLWIPVSSKGTCDGLQPYCWHASTQGWSWWPGPAESTQQSPSWPGLPKQCIKGAYAIEMINPSSYTTVFSYHSFIIYILFPAAALCSLWCWVTCSTRLRSIFVSTPGILKQPGFATNKPKAAD